MPRSAAQALKDALALANPVAADLWTFELAVGTQRWTPAGRDITVGAITWSKTAPQIKHGAVRSASGTEVSTLDVELGGSFLIGGTKIAALATLGGFDNVPVTYERIYLPTLWTTPTANHKVLMFSGEVWDPIEPSSTLTKLTVKSLLAKGKDQLPRRVAGPSCPWAWGSPRCGIDINLWDVADTVAAGSTALSIVLTTGTALAVPGATIQIGSVTRTIVKYVSGTKTATIDAPLAAAPTPGTAVTVWRGCDKQFTTCGTTYANVIRYGGFPFIPDNKG